MSDWAMQNYLDDARVATVEALLARTAEPLVGPLRGGEGPAAFTMSRAAWEAIDVTIDNCRLHSQSDLPVSFCVTGSRAVNAGAYHPADWGLVVITEGLIRRYCSLVLSLLQAPGFQDFLTRGTPVPENNHPNVTPRREAVRHLVADTLFLPTKPDMTVVDLVVRVGFTFLTAHEMGHILNGHLRSGLTRAHVTEAELPVPGDPSVSRTLEFDADYFATRMTLKHLGEWGMKEGYQKPYLGTPQSALRFLFTSAYLVFSLLDAFSDRSLDDADSSSHPHPLVRLVSVLPGIATQIDTMSGEEQQGVASSCSRSVELSLLELQRGCLDEIDDVIARAEAAFSEHVQNWKLMRPILQAVQPSRAPLPFYLE